MKPSAAFDRLSPADRAWLFLAGGVLAWDILGPELLSEASARYAHNHPWIWNTTVVYLACHLVHVIPSKIDPLNRAARLLGR